MTRRFVVEADGGSRGNPGQAAYGALVRDPSTGEVLIERGERIGIASNNVAEYRGLIAGLEAVRELDPDARVEVRMDSKLVVEQMSGRWQVKHPDMKQLAKRAFAAFPSAQVTYTWIPREKNKAADRLVNAALDGKDIEHLPVLDASQEGLFDVAGAQGPARPNRLVGWSPDLGPPTATILVRHGETEHTRHKLFSGAGGADPELTDLGRDQVRAAGSLLTGRRQDIAAIVSSPLRRTVQTAEILADLLGIRDVEVDDDLRETAFGDWDGYSFAEVGRRWPAELQRWLGSTSVAPPFGESFDAVHRRVLAGRDRISETYAGRTVVLVTHVTPIKALVTAALEAPAHALFRMELSPASVTEVHWWADGVASLRSFNVLAPR